MSNHNTVRYINCKLSSVSSWIFTSIDHFNACSIINILARIFWYPGWLGVGTFDSSNWMSSSIRNSFWHHSERNVKFGIRIRKSELTDMNVKFGKSTLSGLRNSYVSLSPACRQIVSLSSVSAPLYSILRQEKSQYSKYFRSWDVDVVHHIVNSGIEKALISSFWMVDTCTSW